MEQLGGQLRVDSKVDEGSSFSFLIPFAMGSDRSSSSGSSQRSQSRSARADEIESLVNALANHPNSIISSLGNSPKSLSLASPAKTNAKDLSVANPSASPKRPSRSRMQSNETSTPLRVLIVEDNDINRTILAKRLTLDGHLVVNTTNGQEGLDMVQSDREFDCVLMDIQYVCTSPYV